MTQQAKPLQTATVSRRGLLGGLLCTALAGSSRHVIPLTLPPAPVAMPVAPEQVPAALPVSRLAKKNKLIQVGIVFSDPAKASDLDTIFYASYDGKALTDYSDFDERIVIPASMQKSKSGLDILDLCQLPNEYRNAQKFDQNANPGHEPQRLVNLTDLIDVTEAAARLNGRLTGKHLRKAGKHQITLGEACRKALFESDNGAMEAAAHHCGLALIEAGYVKYPGKVATGTRAFIDWVNQQGKLPKEEGGYGLSKLFHMETVHGLPPYEALMDYGAFQNWNSPDKRRLGIFTADQHFRKRSDTDMMDDIDRLPIESGISPNIHGNNYWSWLDGVRIMAAWQERYPDKLKDWFPDKRGALAATKALKRGFKSVRAKTGSSNASMGCLHGLAVQDDGRVIYAMTAGQDYGKNKMKVKIGKGRKAKLQTREVKFDNRYKAFAEILNHCPAAEPAILHRPLTQPLPAPALKV